MDKKKKTIWCKMGLHNWAAWFTYGVKYRCKHRVCLKCDASQSKKKQYMTGNGNYIDIPTPYGKYIGNK